jgi:hypothetical protein
MPSNKGRAGNLALVAALGAVVASAPGCSREKLVQGECRQVNGADVCAWHTMQGDRVVAFGATIPVKVAENAPPPEVTMVAGLVVTGTPLKVIVTVEAGA